MVNHLACHPQPKRGPLPWSEIIMFLDMQDFRSVCLTSKKGRHAAMDGVWLKYVNCKSMKLSRGPVTNDRLRFLVESGIVKHQQHLSIDNCRLTADGFAYLAGLNVEVIVLKNAISIPNNCLDYLAEMKSLKSVSIMNDPDDDGTSYSSETDISIAYAIRVLSHLEALTLKHIAGRLLEIDDFVYLGGMHAMKSLALSPCPTGRCFQHIAESIGEQLESLEARARYEFSDEDVQIIASMRSLRSLKLSSEFALYGRIFSPLTSLENLEMLDIKCNITDEFLIDTVRSMHSLRHLRLWVCRGIHDESLQHLGLLNALQTLTIGNFNELEGTGLAHLHQLTSLDTLSLVFCRGLTEWDISELIRNMASLKRVYIWGCPAISNMVRHGFNFPGVVIKVHYDEYSRDEIEHIRWWSN